MRIEFRRSPAVVAALVIAAMTTYIMWDSLPEGVVRWREIVSSSSEVTPLFASVIIAAFAAHRAGVLRQRRMLDQIGVTTYHGSLLDLAGLLAVAGWGVIGYLVPVSVFFLYGWMHATWGGPDEIRLVLAIATMLAATALGWMVGVVVRHRLAPLVAIGLLLVFFLADDFTRNARTELVPSGPDMWQSVYREGWWHHLTPGNVQTAVYADQVGGRAILWLICLGATLWLFASFARLRSRGAMLAAGVSALVTIGVAASVVAFEPTAVEVQTLALSDLPCATRLDDRITVCMHPEDAVLLDVTADAVGEVVAPLVGVPGAPALFLEGRQGMPRDAQAERISLFDLASLRDGTMQYTLALDLVTVEPEEPVYPMQTSPQYVVAIWLLREAGLSVDTAIANGFLPPAFHYFDTEHAIVLGMTLDQYFREVHGEPPSAQEITRQRQQRDQFGADVEAAVDRFQTMPDDERSAWLSENWNALIAGELMLEDLP